LNKNAKIFGILLLVLAVSSMAAAQTAPQAAAQPSAGGHAEAGAQDVITASDSSGGSLSTNDILLIVLAVFGLAAIL